MRVRVLVEFFYDLPSLPSERNSLYGTVDLAKCVEVDLETDAAAFLMEADMNVVSVEEASG